VTGRIRVGIGGWTYEPWRGVFFPDGLSQAKELSYASRQLSAIEINGTYYRTQAPSTFAKWKAETPDDFAFAVKALRYTTNRKVLAEAGESVVKFVGSGLTELGEKLGPILWQFAPTKRFDPDDFGAFLALLPQTQDGVRLRHALEVRHDSFCDPDFVALARKHNTAVVYADHATYPGIADLTADFVYARLQQTQEKEETGYMVAELDRWATVARGWAAGEAPEGLPYVGAPAPKSDGRDAYVFMISGAKVRAPAAAKALIARIA
jgi:uncharacterized protein YecE (DUF72 family)